MTQAVARNVQESRPDVTGGGLAVGALGGTAQAAAIRGGNGPTDGDVGARQPVRSGVKLGRNDPCFCGSGKKYKRCHGA